MTKWPSSPTCRWTGLTLVADTNVDFNDAADRPPAIVAAALDRTMLFHCSVCVGEIAVGVAHADATRRGWRDVQAVYAEVLGAIPETRLLTPDDRVWLEAGLVAGILAPTQGFQAEQRKELPNDALILLSAARSGFAVLTSDRDRYDLLQQLCPEASFVLY